MCLIFMVFVLSGMLGMVVYVQIDVFELFIYCVVCEGGGVEFFCLFKVDLIQCDVCMVFGLMFLYLVVMNFDSSVMSVLLVVGVDLNVCDFDGLILIYMVVYVSCFLYVLVLFNVGVDFLFKNNQGCDVMLMVCKVKVDEMVGVILFWLFKGCKVGKLC